MTNQVNIAVDYSVTSAPTGTDLGEVSPFAPVGKNATLFVPVAILASTGISIQTNNVATAADAGWTTIKTLVTGAKGQYDIAGLDRYVRVLVTDAGTGTDVLTVAGVL